MTMQATTRKIKRSFTISPEAVAYVAQTRQRRGAGSDSEALDLLLREAMLEAKRQEIDAAYKEYYDTASDEDLAEQREWAQNVGPNMFADIDAAEAQS
jgi:hypothetical protein